MKLSAARNNQTGLRPGEISERNQLFRRVLAIQVDGLFAQVAIATGDYQLTSLTTADAAAELRLKARDNVVEIFSDYNFA
jgi:molybdopterin-binding protein